MSSKTPEAGSEIPVTTVFTPNGDGINDTWNIPALVAYPNCTVSIFKRSGKQVYHSAGYSKAWDGKLNGDMLPTGVYYYIINPAPGQFKQSGWVMLVR